MSYLYFVSFLAKYIFYCPCITLNYLYKVNWSQPLFNLAHFPFKGSRFFSCKEKGINKLLHLSFVFLAKEDRDNKKSLLSLIN